MVFDPSKVESPRICPYSILVDSDVVVNNENSDFPIQNALKRSRSTRYKAATISAVTITAKRKTALKNGFFEVSVDNWLFDDGGSTATFAYNTSSPLTGIGDGILTISSYVGTVKVRADQAFTLKKGETWRFCGQFKADAARTVTLKLFASDGTTELESTDFSIDTGASYEEAVYTNNTGADLFGVIFEFQVGSVATIQIDDLYFNKTYDVDALIIDGAFQKHRLRGATVAVEYSHTEDFASTVTLIAAFSQSDDETVLATASVAADALFWRVLVTSPLQLPEFSQLWLGKWFYLRMRSKLPFSPEMQETEWDETLTEGGVTRRYKNHTRRGTKFDLPLVTEAAFEDYLKWYELTDSWTHPYFLQIYPESDPRDILFVFTKDKKFVPKRNPGYVEFAFSFVEQLG